MAKSEVVNRKVLAVWLLRRFSFLGVLCGSLGFVNIYGPTPRRGFWSRTAIRPGADNRHAAAHLGAIVKSGISTRLLVGFVVAVGLTLSGVLSSPVAASLVAAHPVAAAPDNTLLVVPLVYREHSTAHHEKVDLEPNRTGAAKDLHNITFSVVERVVSWARSPRCYTSQAGNDRGVYRYRIYEYESRNGDLVKTGRWVIVQAVIEWGDGEEDRGWFVTAYPWKTNSGAPAQRNGKSWAPSWMTNSLTIGPVNNDIICN